MSIEFLNPKAFWATVAVPLVLVAIVWGLRRRETILNEFGRVDLLKQFSRFSLNRKIFLRGLPTILCFTLMIVAVARPILLGNFKKIMKGTLDVVAILDVSKSMAAEDSGPEISRVDLAKDALLGCMSELAGNRLGIVTFAGASFPQAELTEDFQALRFVLKNWIGVDSAPSQGSSIGKALQEAADLFENNDKRKLILLFSDGGHVRPEKLEGILTDVSAKDITVVSVAIGTIEGARIPVYENGRFKEWFKIDGKEVTTQLNEEILREISQATGGKYIPLGAEREIQDVLKDPGVVGQKALSGGKEIFQIPLALSIVFLFGGMYLERRSA
ncbi:MAG: VWA domain-containing protein [Proteobacteria bacterium]|nr:VWA domain-containing protein [Pseudomonadota bacterium]NIS69823.1 VWA domain-containing protein [Pseudomonadota bacterium]